MIGKRAGCVDLIDIDDPGEYSYDSAFYSPDFVWVDWTSKCFL